MRRQETKQGTITRLLAAAMAVLSGFYASAPAMAERASYRFTVSTTVVAACRVPVERLRLHPEVAVKSASEACMQAGPPFGITAQPTEVTYTKDPESGMQMLTIRF